MNPNEAPSDLTPTIRDLLRILAQREQLGTAYLVPTARGRAGLILPNSTGGLSRGSSYNWATIRSAISANVIEMPAGQHELSFVRQRGDSRHGEVIRLTDAGRLTLHPDTP